MRYLTTVWDEIQLKQEEVRAPAVLFSELSLPLRVIRDFANPETKRIVVDSAATYEEMKSFVQRFVADPKPRIDRYEGAEPIFDHFGIEAQIDANLGRKVWLKSGGYLIVDQSEALTAIDVNTAVTSASASSRTRSSGRISRQCGRSSTNCGSAISAASSSSI